MTSVLKLVKITNMEHVKPTKSVGGKEYQLVTFDLPYLAFYYNQKLMFYKGDDFEGMVRILKDGLRVVLEEFHQLAGKLGKDEDGVFKVEYDDDMDGVQVSQAVADGVSLTDIRNADDESTTTSMLKLLVPYNDIFNIEGLHTPLLAVQITKLIDGVVIGFAFNHAVLDGTSTWHFMSSWAEICRGAETVLAPPYLDRTKARNTRVRLNLRTSPDPHEAPSNGDGDGDGDGDAMLVSPDASSNGHVNEASSNGHTKLDPHEASSNGQAKPAPILRQQIFRFSESAIDKIKSKVNANSPSDGSKSFSTFQSLSVHIWRHVSYARKLKPDDYTVFTIFVDCRKRVDPPMPDSYFGNLIQTVFTISTVELLLTAHAPEVGARLIQSAIEAHNSKAINVRNEEWEKDPKIFKFKDAGVNCVAVGSSPRFKVYDVDFGWGKPESVRSGSNNKFDGMVYLYQGKSGGRSIDVELTLEARAMEELEKDKDFLKDFE